MFLKPCKNRALWEKNIPFGRLFKKFAGGDKLGGGRRKGGGLYKNFSGKWGCIQQVVCWGREL